MRFELQKILLVDDDPDDCFLFRKALADIDAQLQLQFISDCDDLLPAIASGKPNMVFMDINMPKMSGFDCVRQIRELESYQHLPIIMYSCSEQSPFITKAYDSGANLYLKK
ncbi:MAG: hypothetical protein JWP88_51, partial [Flaviaesturariibacter sp.]|nr:hypothetical protein [Flaviaesturariibacter sp.]